jgi:phosphocarrier protein
MTLSADVEIVNSRGLHARAAAKFVRLANEFRSEIDVVKDGTRVPARSILGLITLGAQQGSTITIEISGPDGQSALDALRSLVASGFGESD